MQDPELVNIVARVHQAQYWHRDVYKIANPFKQPAISYQGQIPQAHTYKSQIQKAEPDDQTLEDWMYPAQYFEKKFGRGTNQNVT